MRNVVRTSSAERDLIMIWASLIEHGEAVADRALELIERRCEVLRLFPFGGEACPKFGADMRWFPAGNYVLFYRVVNDEIHLARVLDGRRNLDEAFWRDH